MSPQKFDSVIPAEAVGAHVLKHYLVDLSVETPAEHVDETRAGGLLLTQDLAVQTTRGEGERWDVLVSLRLTAMIDQRVIFLIEMRYLIHCRLQNVPEEQRARVLEVEMPQALSPVMREILERNGAFAGYPSMRVAGLGFDVAFDKRQSAQS